MGGCYSEVKKAVGVRAACDLLVFPLTSYEKLAVKVANGDHMTAECYNCRKCKLVVKHPDRNQMTVEMVQGSEIREPVKSTTNSVPLKLRTFAE